MNVLPIEKQVRVIGALTEGCSIRAIERMTGVNRNTIMSLGLRVGRGCASLHDLLMRDLHVSVIQVDEAWSFIAKKQKRVGLGEPREFGDCYTWIAMDANRKAILSYLVGKRTGGDAEAFMTDLRSRVVNRPQITSDGYAPYLDAIDYAFGDDVDYAMLQKVYAGPAEGDAAHRYSPGAIVGVERKVITGSPDPDLISTSFVERQNLTLRMQMRRFTRLTNAFSKKIESHRAAVSLHVAWYNLCRIHETLRCTPAMALGVANRIWTVGDLVRASLDAPPVPPSPAPLRGLTAAQAKGEGRGSYRGPRRPRLRIIKGGRGS
jgi:IS1 family transposase